MLNIYVFRDISTSVLVSFQPNPSPHQEGACQTLPQEAESTTSLPLTKAPLPAPPAPVPVEAKAEATAELKPALRRKSEEVKDRTGERAKQLRVFFVLKKLPKQWCIIGRDFRNYPLGTPPTFLKHIMSLWGFFCFGDSFEWGILNVFF